MEQIENYGFEDYSNTGGEEIPIDEDTTGYLHAFDWDNDVGNELTCYVMHDDKCFEVEYRCQDLTREGYYSSCSQQQQDALISFVKAFRFHEPAAEGNVFLRVIHNLGVGGCIVFGVAILIFIGMPVAMAVGGMMGSGEEEEDPAKAGQPLRSSDLHEEMNRERKQHGETELPSINTVQGTSTNTLARRDKSWKSVPDFFIQLIRGRRE